MLSTGDWVPYLQFIFRLLLIHQPDLILDTLLGGPSTTVVDKVNYTNDTTVEFQLSTCQQQQDDGNANHRVSPWLQRW